MTSPASPMAIPSGAAFVPPDSPERYPSQPLLHLDILWIQVAGTLCNLKCTHCFVSAGPGNDRLGLMSRDEVVRRVAEGVALGVKEFYFTGGEPFLHPQIVEILEDTLQHGPSTVLTNGTLFTRRVLKELERLSERSRFALEVRVSLDGFRAEDHDRFRGAGSFERAIEGARRLEQHGLLPIITATQNSEEPPLAFRERYLQMLRAAGLARPRLKLLPMFLLGRETERARGYAAAETLRDLPAASFDPTALQCSGCRAVTARGVFVCPLLVDEPGARMGDRLEDSLGPFRLTHGACHTCYRTGMSCANT